MNLEFAPADIMTALVAAADLCTERRLRPLLLLSDSAKEDFAHLPEPTPTETADAVVIGLAPAVLNYRALNSAFRTLIEDKDAQLIATHRAMYYKDDDGLSLGPGAFLVGLEHATEREAINIGKPEERFFRACLKTFEATDGIHEADWGEVAIVRLAARKLTEQESDWHEQIGDDYRNDLGGGAISLGLRRYLVKTGKYRPGDEKKAEGLAGVFDDFAAFVDSVTA